MDWSMAVVLVLMLAAAIFLVLAEKNSRRNEAKLRAEAAQAAQIEKANTNDVAQKQKRGVKNRG
jgi:uncharacterized protein HemX